MSHVDDGTLHAYLDGELPPVERGRLEAHVAECSTCRTQLDEERALVERASRLLGFAQPPERAAPPPPLHQLRQPARGWRPRVPIAWAASVVLALGLGYYLGGTSFSRLPPAAASRVGDSVAPLTGYALQERPASPAAGRPPSGPRTEPRAADQVAARRDELADRAAANARPESIGVASGVVAIQPQAGLRPASPAPVPSAAVSSSQAADLPDERGRLVGTEWPIIRPGPARDLLGADPVGVPGLAVRSIRRSPTGEVVLVEQALDSATVIQLFQRRADAEPARRREMARFAAPAAAAEGERRDATERMARFVGSLRVEIAGPLSADSLNRLLEQLKPIP